jgi:hypothetical protein
LAAKYCRTSLKRGGVCIYIYKKIWNTLILTYWNIVMNKI